MDIPYRDLAGALQNSDNLLARWRHRYERSRLHLARTDAGVIEPLVAGLLSGICYALPAPGPDGVLAGDLDPGSETTRDADKAASLLGSTMAALEATGFEVAASILAVRDVLADLAGPGEEAPLRTLCEWLHVVAMDAYATARFMRTQEQVREEIEQGTPVVLITPTLPAVFLIGAPARLSLDSILSRLLLLIVRVGAAAAIVDATGLKSPGMPEVLDSMHAFAGHRKVAGKVTLIGVGLTREQGGAWTDAITGAGASFRAEESFMTAVTSALAGAGRELGPRSAS